MFLPWLRTVRHERYLNQSQAARGAHTHRDCVAALEQGQRPSNPEIIHRLAAALNVDPAVLTADAITIHRDGRIEVAR